MITTTQKMFVWKNHVGEYFAVRSWQTHLGLHEEISWTQNLSSAYRGVALPSFCRRDDLVKGLKAVEIEVTTTVVETSTQLFTNLDALLKSQFVYVRAMTQPRLGLYKGASSDNPTGATLVKDFGAYTESSFNTLKSYVEQDESLKDEILHVIIRSVNGLSVWFAFKKAE